MVNRILSKINFKTITRILIIAFMLFTLMSIFSVVNAGDESKVGETVVTFVMALINGILGYFLYGFVVVAALIVIVIYLVQATLFSLIGSGTWLITPADIFFNKIPLLSIDFFDLSGSQGAEIIQMKTFVAKWFVTLTGLSVMLLLAVLIYIAIRAVMANTGSSKAKYQKMFVNWVISLVMLMLLSAVIVGTILLNNSFVRIIENASAGAFGTGSGANEAFKGMMVHLMIKSLTPLQIIGQVSSIILLAVIVLQIFQYGYVYIKRMIKVAFLIVIAPMVTITYSIDKISDNKSQALNTWVKMFVFEVFIQTFHALVFAIFFSIAMAINHKLITSGSSATWMDFMPNSLPGMILAIMSIRFVGDGEKIIRQIFDIKGGEQLGNVTIGQAVLIGQAMKFTGDRLSRETKEDDTNVFERHIDSPDGDSKPVETRETPVLASPTTADQQYTEGAPEGSDQADDTDYRDRMDDALQDELDEPTRVAASSQPDRIDETVIRDIEESTKRSYPPKTGLERFKEWSKDKGIAAQFKSDKLFTRGATIAGASFGLASGNVGAAWGLINTARDLGKITDIKREKSAEYKKNREGKDKYEQYIENTREAAAEGMETYKLSALLSGDEIDFNNDEQIEEMQSWFREVEDKADSGRLLEEYEASRMALIKKLQAEQGLTSARARTLTHRLGEEITKGIIPEEGTDLGNALRSAEGLNFAEVHLQRKQSKDMSQYKNLVSEKRNLVYDYDNVKKILSDKENIMILGSAYIPDEVRREAIDANLEGLDEELALPEETKASTTKQSDDPEKTELEFELKRLQDERDKQAEELEKLQKEFEDQEILHKQSEAKKDKENLEEIKARLDEMSEEISAGKEALKVRDKEIKKFSDALKSEIENQGIIAEELRIEDKPKAKKTTTKSKKGKAAKESKATKVGKVEELSSEIKTKPKKSTKVEDSQEKLETKEDNKDN